MRGMLLVLMALAACERPRTRQLDLDLVRVSADARLRTDAVGQDNFVEQATFVLVDCDNTGKEGAYITLGGTLADRDGAVVGELKAQSLWVPAGETRTFALVDRERKPRPTAAAARIAVRGGVIPASPPPNHVGEQRELVDDGRIVVQGVLHSDADRPGNIMVIASFHDAEGRPMTRPFSLVHVAAHGTEGVQFVGPPGSKHGTLYTGDSIY